MHAGLREVHRADRAVACAGCAEHDEEQEMEMEALQSIYDEDYKGWPPAGA